MLERGWEKFKTNGCFKGKLRLPSRKKSLLITGKNGFPSIDPKIAFPLADRHPRIPEEAPECLKILQKAFIPEVILLFQRVAPLFRFRIRNGTEGLFRKMTAFLQLQPAIFPDNLLNGRFSSERTVKHTRKISSAEMSQEPSAILTLHQTSMTGFFQVTFAKVLFCQRFFCLFRLPTAFPGSQDGMLRAELIGTGKRFTPCERHRMEPASSALGTHQIIIAVMTVEMRSFRTADGRTGKDLFCLTGQLLFLRIVFLKKDPGERISSGKDLPVIPFHVEQPFSAICIMKKRRIKAAGIQINRIGPGTGDLFCPNQVIRRIHNRKLPGIMDHRIDQIEIFPIMAQAGRPDAIRSLYTPKVHFGVSIQRGSQIIPVCQVF